MEGEHTYPKVFSKPSKSVNHQDLADRYALLQRKVHDLQELHAEGRKSHLAEQERLKSDLAHAKLTCADYADRVVKMKKHADTQDIRIDDLKKAVATNDIEIKDLRTRLRRSEQERILLSSKKHETSDTKRALQALELKSKEDLKERDRKIYQLEQTVAAEKRRRDAVEHAMNELKLETEGNKLARDAIQSAHSEIEVLREQTSSKELDMLLQLQQHKELLRRVSEDYGRLASQAVAASAHDRLRNEHAAERMRTTRLERKLANSDAQVAELAHLIRQTNEKNQLLETQLRDAEDALLSLSQSPDATAPETSTSTEDLLISLLQVQLAIYEDRHETDGYLVSQHTTFTELDQLCTENLILSATFLQYLLAMDEAAAHLHASEIAQEAASRESLAARLVESQKDYATAQEHVASNLALVKKIQTDMQSLQRDVDAAHAQTEREAKKTAQAIAKEREATLRLTTAMQKNRIEEQGLRAEIEQLTTELTQAEGYEEAYRALCEEVASLLDRNALAEDESKRLSKFNAEILGHHNPAQRILYVDRIRQELADTKHKLLQSTRANDLASEANENLKKELGLYTSVMVPADQKARTNIIRVTRPPLTNQSLNTLSRSTKTYSNVTLKRPHSLTPDLPELPSIPGEMTIDEIL